MPVAIRLARGIKDTKVQEVGAKIASGNDFNGDHDRRVRSRGAATSERLKELRGSTTISYYKRDLTARIRSPFLGRQALYEMPG